MRLLHDHTAPYIAHPRYQPMLEVLLKRIHLPKLAKSGLVFGCVCPCSPNPHPKATTVTCVIEVSVNTKSLLYMKVFQKEGLGPFSICLAVTPEMLVGCECTPCLETAISVNK